MHACHRPFAIFLAALLWSAQTLAANAGWRQLQLPGATPDAPAIKVVLYYPTSMPEHAIAIGPFTIRVAMRAPPDATTRGLIVWSHGTGGSELGHSSLAEALARHGYLVAALRHPGDNWQDRSLLSQSAASYFTQRPQHATSVIDALLRDPEWGPRIASDHRGPRIGAVGHSAGGYTVLALAGGEPDTARLRSHCEQHRTDDPIFCSMGRTGQVAASPAAPAPPLTPLPTARLADARIRAVVALAPVGVVFSARSLAVVRLPVAIYQADRDHFLVPRFHSEWIARNLPGAQMHRVANAWHFAFMDKPGMPIATEDGDAGADPPGFDRQVLLDRLKQELPLFFDRAFR